MKAPFVKPFELIRSRRLAPDFEASESYTSKAVEAAPELAKVLVKNGFLGDMQLNPNKTKVFAICDGQRGQERDYVAAEFIGDKIIISRGKGLISRLDVRTVGSGRNTQFLETSVEVGYSGTLADALKAFSEWDKTRDEWNEPSAPPTEPAPLPA